MFNKLAREPISCALYSTTGLEPDNLPAETAPEAGDSHVLNTRAVGLGVFVCYTSFNYTLASLTLLNPFVLSFCRGAAAAQLTVRSPSLKTRTQELCFSAAWART